MDDADDTITLENLGRRLKKVDEMILQLMKKRMELAVEVERRKNRTGQPIYREAVEEKRIDEVGEWARKNGLNPHFARSIEYQLIDESCKVQLIKRESPDSRQTKGLEKLTAKIASQYDNGYGDADGSRNFPVRLCRDIEKKHLKNLMDKMRGESGSVGLAVDIGCANGVMTEWLAANGCEAAVGFDISAEMVRAAEQSHIRSGKTAYRQCDVEANGLVGIGSGSVSLIVLNLGTGSDFRDFWRVLAEIHRVLKRDGCFFLSFYNKNALIHSHYIPWKTGLNAEADIDKNSLVIRYDGEIFELHVRPYGEEEIKEIIEKHGHFNVWETLSFPTLASILPAIIYEEEDMAEAVRKIESEIINEQDSYGAYLAITGKKIK